MSLLFSYIKSFFEIKPEKEESSAVFDFEAIIINLIDEKKIPGLGLSVYKKGIPFFEKGYGYANIETKERIDPSKTMFRIASVSKPIAATALAKMVEERIVDLDTSLYVYVPYYPQKKYDFTLRQLAGHTAGFRTYQWKEYMLNTPYSIKDGIAVFKDDDLLFQPGKSYQYTSYDWVLLSLAMQEASGIPFEKYVEDKVLNPLGLNDIKPELKGELTQNLTKFYSRRGGKGFREAVEVDNFYKLGGGGYLATPNAIARFGASYLTTNIISPELKKEFTTSQKIEDQLTYYGLGWETSFDIHGRPYYGHTGNGIGGYAIFRVYPEQEMVFSILINCTNPKIEEQLQQIIDGVFVKAIDSALLSKQ